MPIKTTVPTSKNNSLLLFDESSYDDIKRKELNIEHCIEVDSFPSANIPKGSIFTFNKGVSNKVRTYTHGLHVYPAKYIPQFPDWSFEYSKLNQGDSVLDPFCGSGTTLVEGIARGLVSYGCDISPLAELLTKAKTTPLYTTDPKKLNEDVEDFIRHLKEDKIKIDLNSPFYKEGLHDNWEFWFPKPIMKSLLKISQGINSFIPQGRALNNKQIEDIRIFYSACFSSIIKKCSFFDEREIKVRRDKRKFEDSLPDPINLIELNIKKNIIGLIELAKQVEITGNQKSHFVSNNAQEIHLANNSMDLIVTSPPYLNAIDYAMAHKYSLFILGLVLPKKFKDHCRDYIGVTERAVRTKELEKTGSVGISELDLIIEELKNSKSNVDKIRGYIISKYFIEMEKALIECYRVLKPGSLCIVIVGDNVIRKKVIPTSSFLQQLAISSSVGFKLETYFFHQLRNIRLKVNRNHTGGKIKKERVIILKKT